jgi:hypothetical protein
MAAGLEVELDHEEGKSILVRTNRGGFVVVVVVVASSVVGEEAVLESFELVDDSVNTRLDLLSSHTSSLYIYIDVNLSVCLCI